MYTGIINSSLEMRNEVVESKMSDNLQANIFISIRFETCASKEMESSTYSQFIHFLFIFPFFLYLPFSILAYEMLNWCTKSSNSITIFIQFNYKIYKPYFVVLTFCRDMQFSTRDSDNDIKPDGSCAQMFKGAWWYRACHHSNLNVLYLSRLYATGVNWKPFKGYHYSLKRTEMKVK